MKKKTENSIPKSLSELKPKHINESEALPDFNSIRKFIESIYESSSENFNSQKIKDFLNDTGRMFENIAPDEISTTINLLEAYHNAPLELKYIILVNIIQKDKIIENSMKIINSHEIILKNQDEKLKEAIKIVHHYIILQRKTEKMLYHEINKRRTFPKELLEKVKEIEDKTKNDIPKPRQTECIILANKELKIYNEEDLLDKYGKPTDLLISIRDTYRAQKKKL